MEMIKEINLKVIVVANAFASCIMKNCDLFKIKKDRFEANGWDTLRVHNDEIPIIFSSMLTGQRALDNHSFRRLQWLINKAVTTPVHVL